MKKIAIIGTGIMGGGIAANFLKKGHEVVVWNRSQDKLEKFVQNGGVIANSPKEATAQAEVVFEVTANDESSKEVWLGDNGILAGAKPETVLISSATLSVEWIDELAAECQKRGLTFFDMPLTGGRIAAESGTLTLLVGGDADKLEELKPDLNSIAQKILLFGKAGSGTRYKLVLNALQAMHIAGLGEALRLAEQAGLDPKLAGESLIDRPGGVTTNLAWQGYQTQPEPINFSVEWITKDLEYAKKMAVGLNTPLLDDVLREYQQTRDKGEAQSDWTIVTL